MRFERSTVIELADSDISRHWTLVCGLMVDAHARRASVVMPRPTEDVDIFVDYATNRSSLIEAQTAFRKVQLGWSIARERGILSLMLIRQALGLS